MICALIVATLSFPFVSIGEEAPLPVIIDGNQVNYYREQNRVEAEGKVEMKYKDIVIHCDKAVYEVDKNIARIEGNVEVISPQGIIYGEDAVYDFRSKHVEIGKIRVEAPPIYGAAQEGGGVTEEYVLYKGYVTTCDLEKPHYKISAKRIVIYPEQKVVAKNVLLTVGKIPLFYIPYYSHPLDDKSYPVDISPGRNKDWGGYLLTRWRYHLNPSHRGKVLLDWYAKRGLGVGLRHHLQTKDYGRGLLNYYRIEDELYTLDNRGDLFDTYSERSTIAPKYLEDDRYRGDFSYSWQPFEQLSIKSELHKFSDAYFTKDFFFREYEIEPAPHTYTLIDYAFPNSSLSLLVQKQVNDFFSETEYLPLLGYNLYKQEIIENVPLYFESRSSVGNLTKQNAYSDQDDEALRGHTDSILSYESRWGWLTYSPYAGVLATYYSKNTLGDTDVVRNALQTGVSFSTKLYKTLEGGITLFGEEIDKFRHILTPSLSYSYIHTPSVDTSHLFQFDDIDSLERTESVIFRLDNKLQAKNEQRQWDFLFFSPSVEYKIKQEDKGSFFDNITSDLEIYPTPEVSLNADSIYDIVDRAFREVNVDIAFSDKDGKCSTSFGQRYAKRESSQSTFSLSYQITPKVQFRNYLRYEHKTKNFEEQQYVIRRDLHCWLMDLGLDVDRDREFTLWVIFRVKAFPQVYLGFDHAYRGAKKSY